jgi:hypothetical protein
MKQKNLFQMLSKIIAKTPRSRSTLLNPLLIFVGVLPAE